MKKILLLLLMGSILIACSNNDKNEGEGFLTSIENVKLGVVGYWKASSGGQEYIRYSSDGINCFGYPKDNLTSCLKYEIFKQGDGYILRSFAVGDVEGVGEYVDARILRLDEKEFIFYVTKENKLIRVVE